MSRPPVIQRNDEFDCAAADGRKMERVQMSNILPVGCLLAAIGLLAACARSNVPGADQSSRAPRSSAAVEPSSTIRATPPLASSDIRTAPAEPESAKPRAAQTQTSLEALRRGERAVTSMSGPLPDVYFEFNSYDLSNDARAKLTAAADWLRDHPAVRVEIEGHCDELGTSEYNLALGAKRTFAVKDYLISLGVARSGLSTISYGEEIPVCHEPTEECRQKKRRVRFVIIRDGPAV
jgi:peptidoglycan-associated lipoprotein